MSRHGGLEDHGDKGRQGDAAESDDDARDVSAAAPADIGQDDAPASQVSATSAEDGSDDDKANVKKASETSANLCRI